ncbi:MAG: hypothetical protein ACLGJC_18910 [Alphaproteobacteria bacterium]
MKTQDIGDDRLDWRVFAPSLAVIAAVIVLFVLTLSLMRWLKEDFGSQPRHARRFKDLAELSAKDGLPVTEPAE